MSNHTNLKNNQINKMNIVISTKSLGDKINIKEAQILMTSNQTGKFKALIKHMTPNHQGNLPQGNK